jgi:hypothetical protein
MLVVGAGYLAVALGHRAPVVFADEAGYLGNVRWLTGGPRWWMGSAAFYGLGYPALLVPLQLVFHDPELRYRSILLFNVVLCSFLGLVLYALCRKFLDASSWVAAAGAIVACAYPAIAVNVGIAWVEVAAALGVALMVLTAGTAAAQPGPGTFALHAAVIVFLTALHGRFILLPVIALAALLAAGIARADLRLAAGVGAGIVVAGWLVIRAAHRVLLRARWDVGVDLQQVGLRDLLDAFPDGLLRAASGQLWYLLAATAGMVVVGAVALVSALTRARPAAADAATRVHTSAIAGWPVGAYVAALLGGTVLVSIANIAAGIAAEGGAARVDFTFYGRYNEPLVPLLLAAGVTALCSSRSVRWMPPVLAAAGAGLVLCGILVLASRGKEQYAGLLQRLSMPGLDPFLGIGADSRVTSSFVVPVTLGAFAITAAFALLALSRLRRAVAILLVAGFLWIAVVDVVVSPAVPSIDAASPVYRELRARHPRVVAYALDAGPSNLFYSLPFWLDRSSFVSFRTAQLHWPDADLYVGPAAWPEAEARGLRRLVADEFAPQAYWIPRGPQG